MPRFSGCYICGKTLQDEPNEDQRTISNELDLATCPRCAKALADTLRRLELDEREG